MGARLITGARVRRIETNADGLATGATWIDRDGNEHFEPATRRGRGRERDRHAAAAAPARPAPAHPDGLANSSGLVGKRLMMHPFANVAGPVRGAADELAGPVRRPDRVARVLRDRREARLRPRRALGPRAHGRPGQRGTPGARGRADLGPRPPPPPQGSPGPRRELGPLRRGPARRGQPHHAVDDRHRRRSASPRRKSTTRWPTTRGACSTSTSSAPRSRWTPPARTRSRSIG